MAEEVGEAARNVVVAVAGYLRGCILGKNGTANLVHKIVSQVHVKPGRKSDLRVGPIGLLRGKGSADILRMGDQVQLAEQRAVKGQIKFVSYAVGRKVS